MKYTTLLLLIITTAVSCKKTRHSIYRDAAHQSLYTLNQTIDTSRDSKGNLIFKQREGKNIVFTYIDEIGVHTNDGQSGNTFRFQVDGDATSFMYADVELQERLTYFNTWDAWDYGGKYYTISKGTISGEMQPSNFWKITIKIKLPLFNEFTHSDSMNTTAYFIPAQTL